MKKKAIVIDDGYIPIICLDEDDDDDLMIDKDYNVFLDHLRRGSVSPRLEVDNGESDIRRLKIFSCDSKISKLENENPMKNRVHQQGQRKTVGLKAERDKIRDIIQRDNRVAERRKRRIAMLDAAKASRDVPSLETQQEDIQQRVRKLSDSKAETETSRRDDVPLVGSQEDSQRDNTVPLVRTAEEIQLAKRVVAEIDHVERVNRVTEVNDVDETCSRSKEVFVGRRKKNEGSEAVVDKDYMRYLTWLVDSLRDSTTEPMENLQKDDMDTVKESTMVPEMDPLVEVKVEPDHDWSDYIIAMGDSPFLDGEECTPFVASKKVVDLDEGSKKNESSITWFRKELMDVLKQPYDEEEMKQLHRDVSIHRKMTRCRELRKGRGSVYETGELGQSYLESFPDFEKEYKLVVGVDDKARALKLLRGFFFYLKYVSHDGVFKPWEKTQSWQP
ncbi:unnamed protein product [Arabidopsis thaliana]|uniref:Uncharacterized protein n=1 Tax=Arabidopsis thaliana TaxID=3702 RepID=A0A5S9XNV2_ARATH|nr:unnamed protein product [Arabidopsis thaliana]